MPLKKIMCFCHHRFINPLTQTFPWEHENNKTLMKPPITILLFEKSIVYIILLITMLTLYNIINQRVYNMFESRALLKVYMSHVMTKCTLVSWVHKYSHL